jgi:type IV secretory pathway VirB10-like protein
MAGHLAITPLAFAPESTTELAGATRMAAAPASVRRFEQLLYAPPSSTASNTASILPMDVGTSGLRHYVEKLSQRWDAGQATLQKMTDRGQFSSSELVLAQIQMVNCALDMEVSSRCAGMFESGVQTLMQRGS